MPRPKLTLFLDVVSPFAYMAYYVTRNSPVFKQCDITYIPIFLGGVMQACGNTPPIKIKNKDKYIGHDRLRSARRFSIPIVTDMPGPFPPNTLPAQRALCSIQTTDPTRLAPALDALYAAFWTKGLPIGEPAVVEDALAGVFGRERAREIVAGTAEQGVKKLLNENTQKALESGAFGLPWFVARDGEGKEDVFFGFDRLGEVVGFLGLGEGVDGVKALL